jgi:hypothetical protein
MNAEAHRAPKAWKKAENRPPSGRWRLGSAPLVLRPAGGVEDIGGGSRSVSQESGYAADLFELEKPLGEFYFGSAEDQMLHDFVDQIDHKRVG